MLDVKLDKRDPLPLAEKLLWHQVRFLQRHLGVERQP
jgi:hypothetical protein